MDTTKETPKIPKTGHCVMSFQFTRIGQAYKFFDALTKLGLEVSITYANGWKVTTNSRCLAYADQLYRFIYGGAAK